MAVQRADAVAVVDHDRPAVAVHLVGDLDNTVSRSNHAGPEIARDIHSAMKRAFTVERIDALAKRAGDAALYRPQRGRGGQAQPVARGGVMQLAHTADA